MPQTVFGPAPIYARPVVTAFGQTGPTGPSQGPTGATVPSAPVCKGRWG